MTDLSAQKRLAADVLDVGKNRIWFDPDAQGEIAQAITREEIRELVDEGTIRAEDARGNSRGRARERNEKRAYGHRKGQGKRRGKAGARQDEREQWRNQIRAQRRKLRELRDSGELTPTEYRELYRKAGGGEFRSVRYMLTFIENEYGDA
ncbi:50S ribosomal protein L19e [Halovivax limisalsi]|uniref:50S ribosomal protein L19e n=1 Tax=Halovivax limisalsi TaxID=1453760 RepID=UPI001FFD9376|nr:50S ribosomal protein L19e [Halovivax limisalsi]